MNTPKIAVRLTETGKSKMTDWLKANHKAGEILSDDNFLHWETSAVDSQNEGYGHIEVVAWDSIQKRTQVLDFDINDFEYEESEN